MLKTLSRVALLLTFAPALLLAAGFLIAPEALTPRLSLLADGADGLSSLRGDFLAFFGVLGGFALWAARTADRRWLNAPIALLVLVLIGRGTSAVVDGAGADSLVLMGAEALMLAVALFAWRALGAPRP